MMIIWHALPYLRSNPNSEARCFKLSVEDLLLLLVPDFFFFIVLFLLLLPFMLLLLLPRLLVLLECASMLLEGWLIMLGGDPRLIDADVREEE